MCSRILVATNPYFLSGYVAHIYFQSVLFHRLPLSEDPALAMAFSVARRAAAVPLLLVNGTYRKTVRSYLDSSILQHQLQRLNDHGSLKGEFFCDHRLQLVFC